MDFWLFVIIGSLIFGFVGMAIADHKNASKPAGFWLGFFLWPIGLVIAALLGPPATAQKVEAASRKKPTKLDDAIEPDLSNARYKVWLIEAYGIEKNEVLGEFVCGEKSFKSVDEALEFALAKEVEKQAQAEMERQKREIERQAEEERTIALRAEREAAEKETQKMTLIIGGVLLVIAIPFIYQQVQDTQAELARDKAKLDARVAVIRDAIGLEAESARFVGIKNYNEGDYFCDDKAGTEYTFDASEGVRKELRKRILESDDTRNGFEGYINKLYVQSSPYQTGIVVVCDFGGEE